MRSVKRMRHYCDYCKKSMAQKPAMERHEKSCTGNPNRVCGVCGEVGINREAVSYIESVSLTICEMFDVETQKEYLDHLRDIVVEGCPACMLAAVRAASKEEIDFNYKLEHARYWKERDETQY